MDGSAQPEAEPHRPHVPFAPLTGDKAVTAGWALESAQVSPAASFLCPPGMTKPFFLHCIYICGAEFTDGFLS